MQSDWQSRWLLGALIVLLTFCLGITFVNQYRSREDFYKERATRLQIQAIIRMLNDAYVDRRKWPEDLKELLDTTGNELMRECQSIVGTSDFALLLRGFDGWGNRFELEVISHRQGELIRIVSAGPNAQIGDNDDVVGWWPFNPEDANQEYDFRFR